MGKEINVRIILRYNSTDGWAALESANSVLAKGEIGLEYISGSSIPKMKIGNGTSSWSTLPYFETSLPENYTWGELRGVSLQTETTTTESLGLEKPGFKDVANIVNLNKNFDKIDTAHKLQSQELISLGERITALASYTGTDETAIAAELIDARVIADGSTAYESIGEAMRAINKDLQGFKANLDEVVGKSMPSQLILDKDGKLYLADSNGNPVNNSEGVLVKDSALTNEVVGIRSRFGSAGTFNTAAAATQAIDAELQDVRVRANGDTFNIAGDAVRSIDTELQTVKQELEDTIASRIPDGLHYENNMLSLSIGGETIGDPIEIVGGGGGGSSYSYTITLKNLLESTRFSVAEGSSVVLKFKYTSLDEDGMPDGAGTGEIYVGSSRMITFNVPQGENELDITSYLASGDNSVKLKVYNTEGSSRTLNFTISILAFSVSSTFASLGYYNVDSLSIPYVVNGEGTKKVYFILTNKLDGATETLLESTISSSGQSMQYTMSRPQNEGPYILKIYAESSDGSIQSNTISLGMIWYTNETSSPYVVINTDQTTATEGETLHIPYLVFHPANETPDATFSVIQNGEVYGDPQIYKTGRVAAVWDVQKFPAGEVYFQITCGLRSDSVRMEIAESGFDKEIIENGLLMEFNATGRQNAEKNPAQWSYGDIEATFSNIGWKSIDGWKTKDKEDQTVLRLLPGGQMYLPFFPFKDDISSSGYTIEIELATQNVSDYDSIVVESYSGGRGFLVKSQSAEMSSNTTSVSAQFKEDDRVRLTFVVEQSNANRLIYIYVDGVCCGVKQYSTLDNFSHPSSDVHGLTIGAESCGIDIYFIRFYSLAFTATQQLNNYICDRPTLAERLEAESRNDIVNVNATDVYQQITTNSLKSTVPYIIMNCPELPQFKGDKKSGMSMEYVDPIKPERSFTAENCQFNVQGTSSAVYPVKNFKIKFDTKEEGIVYTQTGERVLEGYHYGTDEDSLPIKVLCLKANYASSEQANNTMLVDYYNETCPYRTPPQECDVRVRYSVCGEPIVLFWRNTQTNKVYYQGSYCMNADKDNEDLFGFTGTDFSSIIPKEEQRIECWEFSNNNTALCLFQDDDMDSLVEDSGEMIPRWAKSFERRFPEQDEAYDKNQVDALQRVVSWVASTNTDAATGETLAEPYDAIYTTDTAEYRLAKFKKEFEAYFIMDAMSFYYVFTEVFLLMDSRAKNLFLTTFDGLHWMPFPYDMDSALGINNEGSLTFDYDLEDTDQVDGGNVFTGQDSILWINFRKCFSDKVQAMYQKLRSQKGEKNGEKEFSFNAISTKMNKHQEMWPEVLWNVDNEVKYLQPFYKGSNYLDMAQGDKKAQRNFWLYNAFKYRDSKYKTGDAVTNYILLRLYDKGEIEVTPYSHIYARVQFGNAKDTSIRTKRNETAVFDMTGITTADDLETHIYSSDRIAKIGDLSRLKVGLCNFSNAPKLQEIIIGSEEEGYVNEKFSSFAVGASELLRLVNLSNCVNLKDSIDVSQCPCLKVFKAKGTKITSVTFSTGGRLEEIYLPNTINTLSLREQTNFKEGGFNVICDSEEETLYGNINTLWIDSTPNIPFYDIITAATGLEYVRLANIEWHTNLADLTNFYTILTNEHIHGLTEEGKGDSGGAIVTGKVYIDEEIDEDFLARLNSAFPNLVVVSNGVAKYFIKYVDYDNTLLYSYIGAEGDAAIDPLKEGFLKETPSREQLIDEDGDILAKYEYIGWWYEGGENVPQEISQSYTIVANYKTEYRTRFFNDGKLLYSGFTLHNEVPVDPVTAGLIDTPIRDPIARCSYRFNGWTPTLKAIQTYVDYQATYNEITNKYTVIIYSGEKQMAVEINGREVSEQEVYYGSSPVLPTEGVYQYYKKDDGSYDYFPIYDYYGWDVDGDGGDDTDEGFIITPADYTTDPIIVRALFAANLETKLSWEEIVAASKSADYKTLLPLGSQKKIKFSYNGTSYEGVMELVGHNYDSTADDTNISAAYTFLLKDIFYAASWGNNQNYIWIGFDDSVEYKGPNVGGWTEGVGSNYYEMLKAITFEDDAAILNTAIVPVLKRTDYGYLTGKASDETTKEGISKIINRAETIWTPSASEMGVLYIDAGIINDTDKAGWRYQSGSEGTNKAYVWFTTDDSRIKKFKDVSTQYWTRTSQAYWRFYAVSPEGSYGYSNNNSEDIGIRTFDTAGFVFGFCL